MDYSAKIGRLEEILKSMEHTAMPLEQTLTLYEEGQKLVAECRQFLAEAEGKVKKLEADGTLSDFGRQKEDKDGL